MTTSGLQDIMADARLVEKKSQRDTLLLCAVYFAALAALALLLG